jgi:hypothetical protein
MTGPGAGSGGGDRNKRVDLGGADAVPDTPSTAKRQAAEPIGTERRMTPRGTATATPSGSGMKPIIWIIIAIAVIAVGYLAWGMR